MGFTNDEREIEVWFLLVSLNFASCFLSTFVSYKIKQFAFRQIKAGHVISFGIREIETGPKLTKIVSILGLFENRFSQK